MRTSSHNSMIRRVLRHASVAILQRRIDPDADKSSIGQRRVSLNQSSQLHLQPTSKAFLLPPISQLPVEHIEEPLPSANHQGEAAHVKGSPDPKLVTQASPTVHPENDTDLTFHAQSSANVARKSLSTQPPRKAEASPTQKPSPQATAPPLEKETGESDPHWPRLQTIFRKHQEKQALEQSDTVEEPEPGSGFSAENVTQERQTKAESDHPTQPPIENPSRIQLKSVSGVQITQDEEGEAPAALPRPTTPGEGPVQAQPIESDEIETSDPGTRNLPLQDVWPVQRDTETSENQPPKVSTESHPIEPVSHPPEVVTRAQGPLEQVELNQQSDTPIEFIPPRKPRPESLRHILQKKQMDSQSELPKQQRSDAPQDRKIIGQPGPETEVSEERFPTKTEGRSTILQRKQNTTSSPEEKPNQEMVPTEIGPLPGDLWQILGQASPTNKGHEDTTAKSSAASSASFKLHNASIQTKFEGSHPVEMETKGKDDIEKPPQGKSEEWKPGKINSSRFSLSDHDSLLRQAIEEDEATIGPSTPENSVTREPGAPVVQRQSLSEETQSETTDDPVEEPKLDSMIEPTPSEQLDEHELARRVYAEIRRRLSIERERVR